MRYYTLLSLLLVGMSLWAVPARRDGRVVRQADRTTLTVYAHGDEQFDWLTNEQGQWLQLNEEGNYDVVPALSEAQIQQRRQASPYYEQRRTPSTLNVAPRGLVILAQFQDVKFQTDPATLDSMLNGENFTRDYTYEYGNQTYHITSSGSARKYFEASSQGQYSPQFDVVGPFTASHNQSYYGSNTPYKDANAKLLIKEACEWVATSGINLAEYDHDGDQRVDFVYVIYAGLGEADQGGVNTIWPHAGKLKERYGYSIGNNGVLFNRYACGCEISNFTKHHMGIGLFCHEFGHILGLPDIYSTDNTTVHKTCGFWDIMDYGCYLNEGDTPPTYTGYERFFFGWVTPRVLNEPENVTLNPMLDSNEVLLITATGTSNLIGNDPNPNLFYVLENRQLTGFDRWLPGHGMILTKVNYLFSTWFSNHVNDSESDMHVDIIEADGKAPEYSQTDDGWFGRAEDAFPCGATQYKGISGCPITDIRETDGIITFRFKGGAVTPVETIEHTTTMPQKVMENGQLRIIRQGQRYTTTGQAL